MGNFRSALFPAERRQLPHARWWNITARTVHIAAIGVLLGGHVFDVTAERLVPALGVAILSGLALMAIEIYPSAHWTHQVCALTVYVKVILLCSVPFAWAWRVPILLLVVAIASIGSHMPRKYRHYSIIFRRVMIE